MNYDEWIKGGLQKRIRQAHSAELFEVEGPERERSSAAGMTTLVSPILSPKLDLTPQQRAVGNTYGAYFEQAHIGGSTEFLREFVDGGGIGGNGFSEKQATIVNMVLVAQAALEARQPLRYILGKPRPGTKRGSHRPIRPLTLVNNVCVYGLSASAVALQHRWTITKAGKTKVPDRQRKKIGEELSLSLNAISVAWSENGMNVPYSNIEVE